MKIFIKLLLLLLILACASPFFIRGPNGQPLMSINKLIFPELPIPSISVLKSKLGFLNLAEKTSQPNTKGDIEVYKWRDEKGVVHYSDRQSGDKKGTLTQIKGISILPSAADSSVVKQEDSSQGLPSPRRIPLANIPKLIDDAKQIEQVLQQRKQRQDAVIDGL